MRYAWLSGVWSEQGLYMQEVINTSRRAFFLKTSFVALSVMLKWIHCKLELSHGLPSGLPTRSAGDRAWLVAILMEEYYNKLCALI